MSYNAQGIYKKNNIEKFSETGNCKCKGGTCGTHGYTWDGCYLKDKGKKCEDRSDWVRDGNFAPQLTWNKKNKWVYCSYFKDNDKNINDMSRERRLYFINSDANIAGKDEFLEVVDKYKKDYSGNIDEKEMFDINYMIKKAKEVKKNINTCIGTNKENDVKSCYKVVSHKYIDDKTKYVAFNKLFKFCENEDKDIKKRANACRTFIDSNLTDEKDKNSAKITYEKLIHKRLFGNQDI